MSAAEKTGNIPELLELLAQYYRFKNENRNKIIRSLIYPAVILCLLTALSLFISLKLVPLTKTLLPQGASHSVSAGALMAYAAFIRQYGWIALLVLTAAVFTAGHFWHEYRQKWMRFVFSVPLIGELIKNMEFARIFLNLYVYLKSGVNIIQTITYVHEANPSYITDKLLLVREKVFKGSSLGDAFKQDPFFPPFVCQNLSKGQISGFLPQYLERIHKYYDTKTKESINAMISMVEPLLLALAAVFLLAILCTFILPIYTNMSQMGEGVFQ